MSENVRAFVNGRGVEVPAGSTALDAVRAFDSEAAAAIAAGASFITDSRGLPSPADAETYAGAIYRVIPVRRGEDRQGTAAQ